MSQVLVWKSDADGKLFEDKKKYTAHLRKLAAERTKTRKIEQMIQERENFLKRMGQEVKSIEELENFIHTHWTWFFLNGLNMQWTSKKQSHKDYHNLVTVKFDHMRWNDSVSNTHSCPRNGGVTNWGGRTEGAPRGYSGWQGSINIQVRTPRKTYQRKAYHVDGFGSDYFEDTIVFTGTGGGGGCTDGVTTYNYDVKLFAADFPAMTSAREKSLVWEHLGGERKLEFF